MDSVTNANIISTLLGVALSDTYNGNGGSNNITKLLIGVLGADVGVRFLSTLFERAPKKIPPWLKFPAIHY